MGVTYRENDRWTNHHANQSVVPHRKYQVTNDQQCDGTPGPLATGFKSYQEVLAVAKADKARVRAYGGTWSLSGIAMVSGYLVNTGYTPCIVLDLGPEFIAAADRANLVLAQCGASVEELHRRLWAKGLALPTSGASNGQTIAGAISTGTHGAAYTVGAMQDYVCAIHLVTPTRSFWIEHPDDPITTDGLRAVLPGELVSDAALFRSALVSIGSLGLVHALVLRCVPQYKLSMFVDPRMYDDVAPRLADQRFDQLGLNGPSEPYHFEAVVHPYTRETYLRYMTQVAAACPSTPLTAGSHRPSADALNFVTGLEGDVHLFTNTLVTLGMKADFPDANPFTAEPGVIFGPTGANPSGVKRDGLSTEIGLRPSDLPQFFELAFAVAESTKFLGSYAVRYVKATQATLGWTLFEPVTATVEVPMLANSAAESALMQLFEGLRNLGIPHSFHWGQCLPIDPQFVGSDPAAASDQVRAPYEAGRLADWQSARMTLLDPLERWMFSNAVTDVLHL